MLVKGFQRELNGMGGGGGRKGKGGDVPVETTSFVEEFEVEGGCCLAVYLGRRGSHCRCSEMRCELRNIQENNIDL